MKKLKFLILTLTFALLLSTLAGCGARSSIGSFHDVFNKDDATDTSAAVKAIKEVPELQGYLYVESNGWLALFQKTLLNDLDSAELNAYIVYNMQSGESFKYESNLSRFYTVDLADNAPVFTVAAATSLTEAPTYTAYDASNKELLTASEKPAVKRFADLYQLDTTLYSANNGVLTVALDIPENLILDIDCDAWNEDYYYFFGNTADVTVYDKQLKPVALWNSPVYLADSTIGSSLPTVFAEVLNNGNVFIQYLTCLNADATEYDLYWYESGNMLKYDLVSLILNVKNNTVKEIEVDALVSDLDTYTELAENDSELYKKNGFDNLALIRPIVDGRLDTSPLAYDLVLMNDSGKLGNSVKLADAQLAELPEKIAADLYLIETAYGEALVNAKGKLLHTLNNTDFRFLDSYIIGDRAIYDLSFQVIYNLKENKATASVHNNTVFIKREGTDGYDVLVLKDGATEKICTVSLAPDAGYDFQTFADGYVIYDKLHQRYTYYTVNGASLLGPVEFELNFACAGVNQTSLYGAAVWDDTANDFVIKYYIVKPAA